MSGGPPAPRQLGLFRRLIRALLPESFRADYEREMVQTFDAQQHEARARGAGSLARLWWETLLGIATTAPREHLRQARQDAFHAWRMMRRAPGFAAATVVTLAVASGASTAVFSVFDAVLLRPLPYERPETLAMLWNKLADSDGRDGLSQPEVLDARERLRSVELAAFSWGASNLTGQGEPEQVQITAVTANFLGVLGIPVALGRSFTSAEELPDAERMAILTDAFWRERFGASPAVLGRSLRLDDRPYTIVGVLAPGYVSPQEFGASQPSMLLLPMRLDPAAPRNERGGHYIRAVARLRPGRTLQQAQAELDRLTRAFERENPGEYNVPYSAALVPLRDEVVGEVQRPLTIFVAAVAVVLLVACANVANLLLARGLVRAKEVAVRRAIGASRARVVRQALTEAIVLSAVASVLGLVAARGAIAVLMSLAPEVPRLGEVTLDLRVLAATATLALLTALVFGTLPALRLAQQEPAPHLQQGRGTRSALRRDVRRLLVAVQVALTLVLLVGASLLLQSFVRLQRAPAGFDPTQVVTARLSLPTVRYPERNETVRFFVELLARLRQAPGVSAAGAVAGLPLQGERGDWDFYLEGETPSPSGADRAADWQVVTPGYFEAMGIALRRGRLLGEGDRGGPPVVLVNETLARTVFAGRDPVGRQIRMSGEGQQWMTIVGVVGDVRQDSLGTPPEREVYLPHAQFQPFWAANTLRAFTVVVRAAGDAAATTGLIRQQVRALDPLLPVSSAMTMESVVGRSVARQRLQTVLMTAFASIALLLALMGTFSVLAYQVSERRGEVGVRVALGARERDIVRMVLRQGMAPAAAGVAAGLAVTALLSRLLAPLLFETRALDPRTFGVAALLLLGAALLACALPAKRAAAFSSRGLRGE